MVFKLSVHDDIVDQIDGPAMGYSDEMLGGLPPFSTDDPVPSGYTDISSLAHWDLYWWGTPLSFKTYRNMLIDQYVGGWGTMSDADKKILVRHHVHPAATTGAQLDALWPSSQRKAYREEVIEELQCRYRVIRESPSEKLWVIAVDDVGALTTQEIETDVVL